MNAWARSALNQFSAIELDRCAARREDPNWLGQAWQAADARLVHFDQRLQPCLVERPRLQLYWSVPRDSAVDPQQAVFLGCRGGSHWFAACDEQVRGGRFLDLRRHAARLEAFDAGIAAYARALLFWNARTRHCPACASPLERLAGGHRRRCRNVDCGLEQFPRTDPAVITIVSYQGRALLGRQAIWEPGRYSTLAGFVEPGESVEDAVRREVLEEAGVLVVDCEYHSSQPWPFPASLMLGFTARAASAELRRGEELEDVRWFTPDELSSALSAGTLSLPPPRSVSFRLIDHWFQGETGSSLLT